MALRKKLPWWIAAASLVLLAVGSLLVMAARARERAELQGRIAALEQQNRKLREEAGRQAPPAVIPEEEAPQPHAHTDPRAAVEALTADHEKRMAALREELKQALATADKNDLRAQQLEGHLQEQKTENQRLAASEREVNEDLSRANRVVNALEAELKAKNERLVQVEIANNKLKSDQGADAQRATEVTKLAQELQEVHRRREVYLTSLLRRYREVTDQYRSLSGVNEDRRDAAAPAVSGADLARIQQTISMAEDDLRQVNTLNAQAQQIQRRLTGK